jgi:hypothetical protein
MFRGAGLVEEPRVGWQLLRPGGDQAAGSGGFRRHGAGGAGSATLGLQHGGGDQEVWGCAWKSYGK